MPDDSAPDGPARVAALLEETIRTELQAQNEMAALGLSQPMTARLARALAAEVLYAFRVEPVPG